jgi:DNA-binding response OmpR family regulator
MGDFCPEDGRVAVLKAASRKELQTIPVILLSARAGERQKGLQVGADDYLVQLFSRKELLARVSTHLALGRLRSELEHQVQERTIELQILVKSNLEREWKKPGSKAKSTIEPWLLSPL